MKKIFLVLIILSSVTFAQKTVTPSWIRANFVDKTSVPINVKDYGAVGDGITEDSSAFQEALQDIFNKGGGTLYVPEGIYLISSKLTMPYSGTGLDGAYLGKSIIIKGDGNYANSTSGNAGDPSYGSILKLAYNGSDDDLMIALGAGTLKLEGLTFWTEIANKNILKIISTITYINNCTFFGNTSGANATNDAIVFGGTYNYESYGGYAITDSSGFQGYGTVIEKNYFYRIRRVGYFQTYANGIQFINNTIWNSCGATDSIAAIELNGYEASSSGNYIAGNLIEGNAYPYAIKLTKAYYNTIIGNSIFDSHANDDFIAAYRLEASNNNYISSAMHDNIKTIFSEDSASKGNNNLFDGQSSNSVSTIPYTANLQFVGNLVLKSRDKGIYWADPSEVLNPIYDVSASFSNNPFWSLQYRDSLGQTPLTLMRLRNFGSGVIDLTSGGSTLRIYPETEGDLRLWAGANGTVWLGLTGNIYESNGVLTSTKSTGTAPFTIASTTPVSNLTVQRISTPYFIGGALTDLDMNSYGINRLGSLNISGIVYDTAGVNLNNVYADENTGLLKIVIPENLISNGSFNNWTGWKPDNWTATTPDTTNFYFENDGNKLKFVSINYVNPQIYQGSTTKDSTYGYSFTVSEITDTFSVYVVNNNLAVSSVGLYTGEITADTTGVPLFNIAARGNTSSITIDNIRVWDANGVSATLTDIISLPDTTGETEGYIPKLIAGEVVWSPDVSTSGSGLFNPDGVTIDTTAAGLARVLPAKVTKWDSVTVKLNKADSTIYLTPYDARAEFLQISDSTIYLTPSDANTAYATKSHTHTEFFDTLAYSVNIPDTVIAGDNAIWKVPNNITIVEVSAFTNTGTVTFNIEERGETTPNTAGTDVMTSDLVADTDQQETTTFSNATLDKNDWMALVITSITGDPTLFGVTIYYVKTN